MKNKKLNLFDILLKTQDQEIRLGIAEADWITEEYSKEQRLQAPLSFEEQIYRKAAIIKQS